MVNNSNLRHTKQSLLAKIHRTSKTLLFKTENYLTNLKLDILFKILHFLVFVCTLQALILFISDQFVLCSNSLISNILINQMANYWQKISQLSMRCLCWKTIFINYNPACIKHQMKTDWKKDGVTFFQF